MKTLEFQNKNMNYIMTIIFCQKPVGGTKYFYNIALYVSFKMMHNVNMFPRSKPVILINNLSTCKFIKNGVELKRLTKKAFINGSKRVVKLLFKTL